MIRRKCFINHELKNLKLFIQHALEVQKQVYSDADKCWEYIEWSDEYSNPYLEEYVSQYDMLIRFTLFELNVICEKYLNILLYEYYWKYHREDGKYQDFYQDSNSNDAVSFIDIDKLQKKLKKDIDIKKFFGLNPDNPQWQEIEEIREITNAFKHRNGRKKYTYHGVQIQGKHHNPSLEYAITLIDSSQIFFQESFRKLDI